MPAKERNPDTTEKVVIICEYVGSSRELNEWSDGYDAQRTTPTASVVQYKL